MFHDANLMKHPV